MRNQFFWLAGTAVFLLIGSAPVQARTTRITRTTRTRLNTEDKKFLKSATEGARAEVVMGRLVVKRAEGQDVKSLGQRMIDDHGKELQELIDLDRSKGMRPPSSIDPKAAKFMRSTLERVRGEKFDRAYANYSVKDHKKDIDDYRKEADRGKDPQVKAFAAKMIPTLQEHLSLAQQTAGSEKSEKKEKGESSEKGERRS